MNSAFFSSDRASTIAQGFPVSAAFTTLIASPSRPRLSKNRNKLPSTTLCGCSLTGSQSHPHQLQIPSSSTSQKRTLDAIEAGLEKVFFQCRFFAIVAVFGSLIGSVLCFVKGCFCVTSAYQSYFKNQPKVILLLVEAIDTYLLGTVMLVFGIGLYELFVSNLNTEKLMSGEKGSSSFFGLFRLKEKPKWLAIKSVDELKTKVGHVIVMLLLIGFVDKSITAAINTPLDLLHFSASVLLCSGCLYMLSLLQDHKK